LSYGFTDTKLEANNHIFINQFNFGDSVDSPDASSLPLPLAVGIMKNLDGEIDIDLPISGDLADPSFSIGSVLLTAFSNLITKVVTSPFSILGALVEGDDDISTLHFLANSSDLSPEEHAKALKLADALLKRPKLNLEIRGHADAMHDHPPKQAASEASLILLAKERVRNIRKVLIEQGKVPEGRIFVLDPQISKLKDKDSAAPSKAQDNAMNYVPSFFTISVK
jgi:OmpA family